MRSKATAPSSPPARAGRQARATTVAGCRLPERRFYHRLSRRRRHDRPAAPRDSGDDGDGAPSCHESADEDDDDGHGDGTEAEDEDEERDPDFSREAYRLAAQRVLATLSPMQEVPAAGPPPRQGEGKKKERQRKKKRARRSRARDRARAEALERLAGEPCNSLCGADCYVRTHPGAMAAAAAAAAAAASAVVGSGSSGGSSSGGVWEVSAPETTALLAPRAAAGSCCCSSSSWSPVTDDDDDDDAVPFAARHAYLPRKRGDTDGAHAWFCVDCRRAERPPTTAGPSRPCAPA